MKFAKIWFAVAGWWGVATITPLFFLLDQVNRKSPPVVTHPEFYFGFLVVTLAWQFAFLVIAKDPVRYRLVMLPAMVEKFGFALCCLILYQQHLLSGSNASWAAIDFLLGVGFVIAYLKCKL